MTVEKPLVLDDRYSLEEIIGRGGMADVYRATDQLLLRSVAVKLVREITEPGVRERFVDEARTLASLNHAGLITLLDAGILHDRPYLVMELVTGKTLSACIAQGPVDPERVRAIGRQLAAALAYAHAQGVVHRDVKPSNVLLCDDERVLLADFGIARLVGSAQHHTRTGGTVGSPAYLSPEQVAGEQVGPESDVFSLGLVLLESLTGVRAFTGSAIEAAMARLHAAPSIPDEVAPAWRSLIRAMTRREPDRRPAAAEVAAALADPAWGEPGAGWVGDPAATGELELTQGELLTVPPSSGTPGPSSPEIVTAGEVAPRRRGWAVALAALALLAVVVALAVVAPWKQDTPGSGSGGSVPAGVPSRLQQPLSDLHDAVEGHHP
ncbi:serine/threonine-protein kinase [Nocardioides pocheonensis]|uniref:non-specific serine/threonine protein kinase n=1 Tax=Nocardioides pocheonensis TaxID=661485 RepID=A0A3N0GFZ4_9ACTN|nr:serine/threonine-protein kinase [Nocardioides pocheonensis]RNM11092.1 serine/threonine protein kinase [Nocardioides pocheonensis]